MKKRIRSMTGSATFQQKSSVGEIQISARSRNGRYLECRWSLPPELTSYELEFQADVVDACQRGHIEISVHIQRGTRADKQSLPQPLLEELSRWHQTLRATQKHFQLPGDIPLEVLVGRIPASVWEQRDSLKPKELGEVRGAVRKALVALRQSREEEGAKLAKELLLWVAQLEKCAKTLAGELDKGLRQSSERFRARWQELMADVVSPGGEVRITGEIVAWAERGDFREELVRLNAHLQEVRKLIASGGAVGKQLDFYSQELLREINTIGSKSQLASTTALVVECKTAVDRFKEQVQNIE